MADAVRRRRAVLSLVMILCRILPPVRGWLPTSYRIRPHCLLATSTASTQSLSSSEFVTHVRVKDAGAQQMTVEEATAKHITVTTGGPNDEIPQVDAPLNARQLLNIGAIWHLSAERRQQSESSKPLRLALDDSSMMLQPNDYLRIHHEPRRFVNVYKYNWTAEITGSNDDHHGNDASSPVVVARNETMFWIINKPPNIPVHATVDNVVENVAYQIQSSLLLKDPLKEEYVSTPQRLDQNTSGLFCVARNKGFAAYFAKLLRNKTSQQVKNDNTSSGQEEVSTDGDADDEKPPSTITKVYKCLVCLIASPESSSMAQRYQQLQYYDILKHYLEPSIRAPKRFVKTMPEGAEEEDWPEALMRIRSIGPPLPLIVGSADDEKSGNPSARLLAQQLWNTTLSRMPDHCLGVAEVELELLTGRTHQVRGQLAAEGFPLVGDTQYGGAIPVDEGAEFEYYSTTGEQLALQCSQLEFLDPDVVVNALGRENWQPSNRWNRFRLDKSWWTSFTEEAAGQDDGSTTSASDLMAASAMTLSTPSAAVATTPLCYDLLPPRVQLSPGTHKYILISVDTPDDEGLLWFVKSAAPSECGGPYHANVASDLLEWLQSMDLSPQVTGGGRIDYSLGKSKAHVYGFSYGFGKGDHAKAAELIAEHLNVAATFNDSAELY